MRFLLVLILLSFFTKLSLAKEIDEYFFIGKMESYNKNFILYFKTRKKPILARGEYFNYLVKKYKIKI